jgi:hypothetical protein
VLDVACSVGSPLSIPLTACIATPVDVLDPSSCSITVYEQNTARLPGTDWYLDFKVAVDSSCTQARVQSGLCSACSAAAAAAGKCPAGTHTFITDIVAPGGLKTDTVLGIILHVGSSVFSSDVMVQFEVMSDTRGLDEAPEASARMQTMLVSTKVL